jgi:ABC-type multidrug transport system ATPase subunit
MKQSLMKQFRSKGIYTRRRHLRADDIRLVKNKKTILEGVSVEVRRGECLGLVGPTDPAKAVF